MVVQHNLTAMNSNRMLGVTTSAQAKSSEKLSSGYRINRAADDAAGLTISEKMRKQMRGLDRASTNAQDGVSAVQTAEGALTEVHSMLQRMNELANQAANGSNSESDRDAIQAEVDQLTTEIDRVSETTKFNETYLLKGDADGATKTSTIHAHDAGLKGKLTGVGTGTATFTMDALKDGDKITIAGKDYTIGDLGTLATKATGNTLGADDDWAVTAGGTGTKATVVAGTAGATTKAQLNVTFAANPTGEAEKDAQNAIANYLNNSGVELTVSNTHADTAFAEGALGDTGYSIKADGTIYKTGDADETAVATVTATGANADGTETLKAGTVTDATYTAATVGIKDGTKLYDADGKEFTAASLAKAFDEDHDVKVYTKAPSMKDADANGVDDGDTSLITAAQAYKLIQNELKSASDIGTDTASTVADVDTATTDGKAIFGITEGTISVAEKLSFKLHVGADADMTNKIGVDIESMSTAGLGINGLNVSDKTGVAATYAIDAIQDAISKVSSQRSALGAVQNRLEHTIANLDNVVENTTAAESRIRDTDMAEEMVNYSKNNILAQAGQSMLAQANQANQGVLSLLQ